jgi:hypothetical protein
MDIDYIGINNEENTEDYYPDYCGLLKVLFETTPEGTGQG